MKFIGYTRKYYEHNEDLKKIASKIGTKKQKEESINPGALKHKNSKRAGNAIQSVIATPRY